MVKAISTRCGDGGKGIYVCGDTGLTNEKPSLTATSWIGKSSESDDVGIYVAGTVKGGSSPSTTLLGDSSGAGGEGIDHEFDGDYLCEPYNVETGHRPTFDADRGIVLVATGGKVIGGASGAPNETTISGESGADAMNGGTTGGPTASTKMSASYFVINGEVTGGYGSCQGGSGFNMKEEREDTSSGDSEYFCGAIYGSGTIRGGDSGKWPHLGISYTADSNGVITEQLNNGSRVVCGKGINLKFNSHEEATTIGAELSDSTGEPAKLMTTEGTFSVTPSMTPFATGASPDDNTKLSCTVTTPDGYNGKVYISWSAEYETSSSRIIRSIEGANGAYNDIGILSNDDYPYGWTAESYGLSYHINVATREHIAERVLINDSTEVHIYCHVLLEDGRFIDNDDIWFSKERRSEKGWGDGSGDDPGQVDSDQAAADNVHELIDALPLPSMLTLDHADQVAAARTAYEGLTDTQKALLAPYPDLVPSLVRAEAKIAELKAAQGGDPGQGGGVDPGQGGQQVDPTAQIYPPGTSISKLKKAKKGFTVKWRKQTAKVSGVNITGYQIQYSLKKNFKSKTKTVTINGYSKASKKIGKLKKKKTYYVKIRTFVKANGQTYYSGWSGVKKVKTK